ncbi:MAG: zinc-finger domain-containing protein [Gammaproteobacteria bacterium]|nr:zinc-finger domain-containing protein [Gammaproteobacteria bacterium]
MSEARAKAQHAAVIEVSRRDLPLSCPNAGTDPAALHPRVYIPLKKAGESAVCPYCGAEYQLKE